MKVIKPRVELIDEIDRDSILRKIERCGRICYKSEDKITEHSAVNFVRNIIKRGHESVIEHVNLTFLFICDRGVSHEIVRHRIASYSQESTRYCNYSSDKFGNELTFIEPIWYQNMGEDEVLQERGIIFLQTVNWIENAYNDMIKKGANPEEARSILPNSLKTEIVTTMNLRQWRHFLKLRCSKNAHPQMREVANKVLTIFKNHLPEIVEDINYYGA